MTARGPKGRVRACCCVLAILVLPLASAAANPLQTAPTGNVEKGKALFTTYRCYACHGYAGETGSPRLVPMKRDQANFIAYLRKPTGAGMPAYADVPEQALADVYAYIRSLSPASPPVDQIPLLEQILREVREEKRN